MPTAAEEQQVRDFLKRAEVRTMKKDLQALREVDALKERDKIAKLKTLEEQLQEHQAQLEKERAQAEAEKSARNEVLQKNEKEERIAEKDLKNYATEQERQQIFLLESQRLGFEAQVDEIDKKKDPELKLEKNNLLIKLRDWQTKLNSVLEEEKKLEDQEKFLTEKSQSTTAPAERKSLEESRWDFEKKIKDIEKSRWEIERQMELTNEKISQINKSSEQLVLEKNDLRNKILGADKSLREIYSAIISREEERRSGQLSEQRAQRETLAKAKEEKYADVRRQQWSPAAEKYKAKEEKFKSQLPKSASEKIMKSAQYEEEQRKKFLQEVQAWSETGGQQTDLNNKEIKLKEESVVAKASESGTPKIPIPPVPRKK